LFNAYVYRLAEIFSDDGALVQSVPEEQYISELSACKTFPICFKGQAVGGAVMRQDRFHIAVMPMYRGRVGRQIIKAMEWGLSISNPFIANVRHDNIEALRIVEFYNHHLVGQDALTLTFSIEPRGITL
jgi:hypothetical protein